ncbi:hypothetical protein HK096_010547, partial [Nowakowskiella sp. JEL0078]
TRLTMSRIKLILWERKIEYFRAQEIFNRETERAEMSKSMINAESEEELSKEKLSEINKQVDLFIDEKYNTEKSTLLTPHQRRFFKKNGSVSLTKKVGRWKKRVSKKSSWFIV